MASDPHPLVRAFRPDEWRVYRELRLRALADSPDAFGSTLAAEQGGSDEDWAARLARGAASENDLPLVTERGRRAVGLLWARIDPADARTAHLYQMWVTP